MPGSIWITIIRDGHQDFADLRACTLLKDDHHIAVVEAVIDDLGVKQGCGNGHTVEERLECLFQLLCPGSCINGKGAVDDFDDMGCPNGYVCIRWIPPIHRHPSKLRSGVNGRGELIDCPNG